MTGSNSAPVGEIATNITRTENEDLDAALDAARSTGDSEQQIAAWADAQEVLADLNTFVFLVHNELALVGSTRVQDVESWTFPDGTPGRSIEQTVPFLYQVWLAQ